jgi:simple sugar transport system permease protein
VAVAFRAGVWNIGAEGQLLVGAGAATAVVLSVPPGPWSVPLALVAGAIGGALWASLAAALRELAGVNEILSTILLNLIAQAGISWAVHGPLRQPGGAYPQSASLPTEAWLWRPLPPGRLHLGLVLAVIAVVVFAVILRRTVWGLELAATGDAPEAARACGVRTRRLQFEALVLSGLVAGIGGAVELTGITHRLFEDFSPGYGYSGIAVALLGGLAPGGTAVAALLFGAMAAAAGGVQRAAGVPAVAALLIQGVVVIALACTFGREKER